MLQQFSLELPFETVVADTVVSYASSNDQTPEIPCSIDIPEGVIEAFVRRVEELATSASDREEQLQDEVDFNDLAASADWSMFADDDS